MGGLQGGSKGSAAVGGARAPPAPPLAPSLNQISWSMVISDGDEDDADEVSWAVRSHGARRCRVG
jgi:hypothetical protein